MTTLLSIVQDILNDLDSDAVSSINDTVESGQVAQIVKTTYEDMCAQRYWPVHSSMFSFDAPTNLTMTTAVRVPSAVSKVEWIKYNVKKAEADRNLWKEMTYYTPDEFMDKMAALNSTASTVESYTLYTLLNGVETSTGISIFVENDSAPSYYTSFDDEILVFNSYNATLDSRIQVAKMQGYGSRTVPFTLSDGYVIDLPEGGVSALRSEAKSRCFVTLKQSANSKEEQNARRGRMWMAREKWKNGGGIKFPNYGRK